MPIFSRAAARRLPLIDSASQDASQNPLIKGEIKIPIALRDSDASTTKPFVFEVRDRTSADAAQSSMQPISGTSAVPLSAERPNLSGAYASGGDRARLDFGVVSELPPIPQFGGSALDEIAEPTSPRRSPSKPIGAPAADPSANGPGLTILLQPATDGAQFTVAFRPSAESTATLGPLQWESQAPGALPEAIWAGTLDAATNDARLNLTRLFSRPHDTGSATARTSIAFDGAGTGSDSTDIAFDPDATASNELRVDTIGGYGIGGGGGGGSGTGTAINAGPVYDLPTPVSLSGSLATTVHLAFFQASGTRTNRRATLAQAALAASQPALAASQSAVVAAPKGTLAVGPTLGTRVPVIFVPDPKLPAGVLGYTVVDLQPALWAGSEAWRIHNGKSVGFVQNATGTSVHAALWTGVGAGIIDLHPASGQYSGSQVFDVSGSQQVGIGSMRNADHALLWHSSNTAIDLNPTGFRSSYAMATTGSHQLGYGYQTPISSPHALLWSGDNNAVDLNPDGYLFSYAMGASDDHQVGYGLTPSYGLHALAWAGGPNTVSDLHPTSGAFSDSRATTLSGSKAAGQGADAITRYQHAILWTSFSGDSAVDLNPEGFLDSQVTAMNSTTEVGYGRILGSTDGSTHALLWTGTAAGFTDLNLYLPDQYTSAEATGIDASGTIVGYARDSITGQIHAVQWLAEVPEPVSLAPFATLAVFLAPRRRSKRLRRNQIP